MWLVYLSVVSIVNANVCGAVEDSLSGATCLRSSSKSDAQPNSKFEWESGGPCAVHAKTRTFLEFLRLLDRLLFLSAQDCDAATPTTTNMAP